MLDEMKTLWHGKLAARGTFFLQIARHAFIVNSYAKQDFDDFLQKLIFVQHTSIVCDTKTTREEIRVKNFKTLKSNEKINWIKVFAWTLDS